MHRILGLVTAILLCYCTTAVAQTLDRDSVKITQPDDSSLVQELSPQLVDSLPRIIRLRFSNVSDSLLRLIFGDFQGQQEYPDRPQASSSWQSDPSLYRLAIGMWGDLETFYPLGLTPSHLSRSDNFVGEQSFANPVPLPYSEEWLRVEPSQRSYFLTPSLSGLVLPLGRSTSIYQQNDLGEFDTATSSVYVNRGRGGFANTTFDFASNFGSFGSIRADGTFQKNDGLFSGADSKLSRMRLTVEPRLRSDLLGRVHYSFNRLRGNRVFFPTNYQFDGNVTDNFATLSTSLTYLRSEDTQLDLRLSYRNDDQQFDAAGISAVQRFRVVESQLEYQLRQEHSTSSLVGTSKYLHYRSQGKSTSSIYFDIGVRRLGTLSQRASYFAAVSLIGSDKLNPAPNLIASTTYQLSGNSIVSLIGGWRSIQPQPEMMFLEPVQAMLADTVVDYAILPDAELGVGSARSLEVVISYKRQKLNLQLVSGAINMTDVSEWQFRIDSLTYGGYNAVEADKNVLYGTVKIHAEPFNRVNASAAYGLRYVSSGGNDVTSGPIHTANGSTWYRFPINRYKLWMNIGVGATFRSAVNRYLAGGRENSVIMTESYFSFDLKRFHFYFNYHNLLDVEYTLNNIRQPGRSVWWGFKWNFVD